MTTEATSYMRGMRLIPPLQFSTLPKTKTTPEIDLEYHILTPMVGGGIMAMEPDEKNLARATALRGSWRWWFRAVCPGSEEEVRQKEIALFGGVGKEAVSSLLRVHTQVTHYKIEPAGCHQPYPKKLGSFKTTPDWKHGRDYGYGLFPLQRTDEERKVCKGVDSMPTRNVVTELKFQIKIRVHPQLWQKEGSKELLQIGLEALQWWSHFGGMGGRTRRGFGAVELLACTKNTFDGFKKERFLQSPSIPSQVRVSSPLCGAQVLEAESSSVDPINAHQEALRHLKDFRQGPGIGRDPEKSPNHPGRSRWPEADLLKRVVEEHAKNAMQPTPNWDHPPHKVHGKNQDIATLGTPRAAFGMPLLIRFKDPKPYNGKQDSPANTDILPAEGKRWPSPVLFRPHKTKEGRYKTQFLILSGFTRVGYGQAHTAEIIVRTNKPIHEERHPVYTFHRHHPSLQPYFPLNGRQDAVSAFATYLTRNGYTSPSNHKP